MRFCARIFSFYFLFPIVFNIMDIPKIKLKYSLIVIEHNSKILSVIQISCSIPSTKPKTYGVVPVEVRNIHNVFPFIIVEIVQWCYKAKQPFQSFISNQCLENAKKYND